MRTTNLAQRQTTRSCFSYSYLCGQQCGYVVNYGVVTGVYVKWPASGPVFSIGGGTATGSFGIYIIGETSPYAL